MASVRSGGRKRGEVLMNKRQSYREYATEAMRFYAREGSKEKYIKKLVDDIIKQAKCAGISNPTEAMLLYKERILHEKAAELADLEAAEKALSVCGRFPQEAVEMVYMKDCWKELEWGDISTRVHYAEIHIPASQAQIYRWLAHVCKEFAIARNLRT
jgi:hypothetical protein